ncbi:S-adenosyl-L-methionine-dependent methyltransferase [Pseudovirgaria hyperparasitica]|uniref:S-adenosyl-L-methionine-dependent methyltransferase n=1 Tax=Pseudovirgaria hyperparasitica TaxID=470096 RepID=A0A6A6VXN4_9PEZI|nr:S-adenosyl-L-methionine-dependent methyltransferase [Pseudovirgaria hyperparasitica]KAF2754566.1 S-adenosyl-L-methionine-dependent methyltransferase [Pseudovirgaria hyperparasitica]
MSQSSKPLPANLQEHLDRAYTLDGTPDANNSFYNQWADSYDEDFASVYASPRRAVETVIANLPADPPSQLKILDAGCGTGLVGTCLAASPSLRNKFLLDGIDLSPGMLAAAARKTGIYQDLAIADLNARIPKPDESYDVVLCVGTLTKAHVGPGVLAEFVRLAVKGGLVVVTVHGEVFESGGYRAEVERLRAEGVVQVVSLDDFGILNWAEEGGRMVVLRRV